MAEELARVRAHFGPVLQSRWYVEEYTPGYNTGGYYDQDIPAEFVRVSRYFDTPEEAEKWKDEHEPDKGKKLLIRRENLYERKYKEWRRG